MHSGKIKSHDEPLISERAVFNSIGMISGILMSLTFLSVLSPASPLKELIGVPAHIALILAFMVVGIFAVACVIHLDTIDAHPSIKRNIPRYSHIAPPRADSGSRHQVVSRKRIANYKS